MNVVPVIGLLRRPATASGGQFPNGTKPDGDQTAHVVRGKVMFSNRMPAVLQNDKHEA
jgi:hypothetical protein